MHKTINLAGLDPYAGACEEKNDRYFTCINHINLYVYFFGTHRIYVFKIEH